MARVYDYILSYDESIRLCYCVVCDLSVRYVGVAVPFTTVLLLHLGAFRMETCKECMRKNVFLLWTD